MLIKPVALDSGPLSAPSPCPRRNIDIAAWLDGVLAAGVVVYLPEKLWIMKSSWLTSSSSMTR